MHQAEFLISAQSSMLTSLDLGTIVSALLMIVGAALVTWGLVKARARGNGAGTAALFGRPNARAASSAESLNALARDLEELSQRLASQLDAKADRLDRLIREAEDRIAELEANERLRRREPVFVTTARARHGAPGGTEHGVATMTPPRAAPAAADPLTARIYELANDGLGAADIARTLGEPIGKVQLILALRGG